MYNAYRYITDMIANIHISDGIWGVVNFISIDFSKNLYHLQYDKGSPRQSFMAWVIYIVNA